MLGDILRRSVSLIMLPIYTRYLTPEDYGVVELLSMLIDFVSLVFGARVGEAVFRFYCTASSEKDKKSIIASALLLSIILSAIGAIIVTIFSGPLANSIFSDESFKAYIALFAINLFLEPFLEIPLIHIRAQQKAWLFFMFSVTKLILQLALNIYLVVLMKMHVEGVIYSAVITSTIMGIILTGYSVSNSGMNATRAATKTLFSFSLPLKLAALCSFYLAFGDRYILNMFTDLSQVGIYSLGYKFGFIFLFLTWVPFQKMWDSERYVIHKKPDAIHIYKKIFLYVSFALILAGLCISLFTKDLLIIMSAPAFQSAYEIVPIIIIAYIFQAWSGYCNLGILLSNKTMHIAYAEVFGALIITIAYFTLIPLYGIYGAALSTVIGFASRFFWTYIKSNQYYNMHLPWKKVLLMAILAALFFYLSLLAPNEIMLSILWRIALIISFVTASFALPIFSKNEKDEIWNKVRNLRRAFILGNQK